MTTKPSSRIAGDVYPATREGFRSLLAVANEKEAEGYVLVTIVRLESSLAVVYRKAKTPASAAFFSETPEEDAEDW
jgi:hypothetical protein